MNMHTSMHRKVWVVHNNNMRWDHSLNGQSTYSIYCMRCTRYRLPSCRSTWDFIIDNNTMSLCRLETILKKSPGLKLDAVSLVHSGTVCIYKPSTVVRLWRVLFNWKPGWWVGKNKLGSPQLHSWNQSPGSAWSVQLSDSLENWGSCRWMILLNVCYPKADLRESARRSNLWMPVWRYWSGHSTMYSTVSSLAYPLTCSTAVWEYRHCSHVTSPWTSVNSHYDFSFASPWHPFMHSFVIPV